MARGQADFGAYTAETYLAGLSDMAELAVRLGSIVIFDRRGKVIDLDDCEGTLFKWYPTLVGDGAAIFDSTNPKSGSQCIKLTSGGGLGDHAAIEKRFPPLASQILGFEICFSQPDTDTYLDIIITYHDGTNSHSGKLRIDFNAKTISYWEGAAIYTKILDVDEFHEGTFFYYPIKLVVDLSLNYFKRLLFAGTEYDLSTYPLRTTGSGAAPHFSFTLDLVRRTGAGGDIYIDDSIITEDEP